MNSRERGLAPGCSYQRLEFLGDAALDLLLMAHHYVRDRHVSPGYLSEMRSVAVNNERLAQVAVELGVAHQLRHGSQALHRDVTQYTKVAAGFGSAIPPSAVWGYPNPLEKEKTKWCYFEI